MPVKSALKRKSKRRQVKKGKAQPGPPAAGAAPATNPAPAVPKFIDPELGDRAPRRPDEFGPSEEQPHGFPDYDQE